VHNRSLRREDATAAAKPAVAAALCRACVQLFRGRHVPETYVVVAAARYHDLVQGVHEVSDADSWAGLKDTHCQSLMRQTAITPSSMLLARLFAVLEKPER